MGRQTTTSAHPDEETLEDFARGRLTQARQLSVVSHVEGCARCRELLVELGRNRSSGDEEIATLKPEVPARGDPLLGTMLGEYRVLDRLSQGGMGQLYRGEQPEIGKRVAIKVLLRSAAEDPELVGRLLQEARAVNAIRHPNIIDIFSFGRLPDGRHYFVMELLEGITVHELVETRGPVPVAEALVILEQTVNALEAAHAVKVIHRDVKPANLIVTERADGNLHVTLLDFGLAKTLGGNQGTTSPNLVLGTPGYMAPEQIRGQALTVATDMHALGVLAWYLLSAKEPYDAPSVVEMMFKQLELDVPRLRPAVDVPPALDNLIVRMMAKKAADRPSAAEVRRELGALRLQFRKVQTVRQGTPLVALSSLRKAQQLGPIPGEAEAEAKTHVHGPPSAQSQTLLQVAPGRVTEPELPAQDKITDGNEAVSRQTIKDLPLAMITTTPDQISPMHRTTDRHASVGGTRKRVILMVVGLVLAILAGALGYLALHRDQFEAAAKKF